MIFTIIGGAVFLEILNLLAIFTFHFTLNIKCAHVLLKTIINKKYNITLIINNLGNYNKYINISYYTKYKKNRINNIII